MNEIEYFHQIYKSIRKPSPFPANRELLTLKDENLTLLILFHKPNGNWSQTNKPFINNKLNNLHNNYKVNLVRHLKIALNGKDENQ